MSGQASVRGSQFLPVKVKAFFSTDGRVWDRMERDLDIQKKVHGTGTEEWRKEKGKRRTKE